MFCMDQVFGMSEWKVPAKVPEKIRENWRFREGSKGGGEDGSRYSCGKLLKGFAWFCSKVADRIEVPNECCYFLFTELVISWQICPF